MQFSRFRASPVQHMGHPSGALAGFIADRRYIVNTGQSIELLHAKALAHPCDMP